MTLAQKVEAYDKALKEASIAYKDEDKHLKSTLERIFPELKASDERVRKCLHELLCSEITYETFIKYGLTVDSALDWLEKQGEQKETLCDKCRKEQPSHSCQDITELGRCAVECEQKPCMIQWKGDNLKEVIDFTGKDKNFEKWFKSFEEYEKYVQEHDGIFKLFNADGSHYEVPVGAWIVKTPDGYNVASKAILRQKSVDTPKFKVEQTSIWSEEDEISYNYALAACKYYGEAKGYADTETHQKTIDWLKSIKDRYSWKPSDEQLDALQYIYRNLNPPLSDKLGWNSLKTLELMYQELKKLKG